MTDRAKQPGRVVDDQRSTPESESAFGGQSGSPAKGRAKTQYEVIHMHRRCDGGGGRCREIVTHWSQPVGYVGNVDCRYHASEAR